MSKPNDREVWSSVPGLTGIDASNLGRVRTTVWNVGAGGHIYSQRLDRYGYWTVTIRVSRQRPKTLKVHRLVAAAFHGPAPDEKAVVRHIDGNQRNNVPRNLKWGTPAENSADRERHGNTTNGERHHKAKLTARDVAEIRRRARCGESRASLAREFGVSDVNVSMIAKGRTWKHVS